MRDFRPFPSPRPGKCTQSATLRQDPGQGEKMVDELEPGYPLEVYGYVYVSSYKWYRVKALPKPPGRDEAQWGWIYAPLVVVEDVPQPPPPVEPPSTNEWWKFWSIVAGVIATLGALLYACAPL